MPNFVLPNDEQSILLVGKNGSGKTRAAVWHLAQRDLENETWIVINHKREALINSIPGAQFKALGEFPDSPGVYVYTPRPEIDDEAVSRLLWQVYESGNIGVYIDEGYMINPRDQALNSLYTQGRAKKIPMITLSQRPTRISRFAVSEAAFFQVFNLTDRRDRKVIGEFVPQDLDEIMVSQNGEPRLLKPYHSLYYNTVDDAPIILKPVPDDTVILEQIREKLEPEENYFELDAKKPGRLKFI